MVCLLVLAGCAKSQPVSVANNKTAPTAEIKSSPLKIARKNTMDAKKGKQEKYYYIINNQKFRATASAINAGVKVFDMQLHSYAFVTNKVVAVLKDSSQFKENDVTQALVTNSKIVTNGDVNFHFVADGVVEISCQNKRANMLQMYKTISAMPNVTQAELILQYQGRISPQEY